MVQKLVHSDVQVAEPWNIRVFLREVNIRLRRIIQGVNELDRERWDDLRFPAGGLSGGASTPTFDATHGTALFPSSGPAKLLFSQVQMAHSWQEGTYIVPHVHWCKTTSAAGDVVWDFDYKHANIGEVRDASFTNLTNYQTVDGTPDNDTAGQHLITRLGEIDMSGRQISDMLLCKITRDTADGNDTYGADAELFELDIHFKIDSRGSEQEFIK